MEQGRAIGAKYLVAGVLHELKVVRNDKRVPRDILKPFGERVVVTYYQSSLRMVFCVIDVETQQMLFSEPLNVTSRDFIEGGEITSITDVVNNMQSEVKSRIRSYFPLSIKIVAVESTNKNGMPETVLINGGGTMFTSKDTKNIRLGVFVSETVGEFKRERQVGELKVMKVEGELVKCQVKDGEKEIQERMTNKTLMVVKIMK